MASGLVFGFETEWMNFCVGADPHVVASSALASLAQRIPSLPSDSGIFLENSTRCYVDCGGHLETCTPEVSSPLDLVAAIKAMERILLDIAKPASRLLGPAAAINFGRANVDPSSNETYGQHESFLTEHPPDFYVKYLVPFLVTRPVWSGSGGIVPGSSTPSFAVAPRLLLFSTVASSGTTSFRPIFNLRDESLAGPGNYRLHIIAGETLSSECGLYLKSGVTALVVRVAELGGQIGFEICDPLTSMYVVARDPSCKQKIRVSDGRLLTALEIQGHYLELVEKHLADLPAWAPAVCRRWRMVLAALAEDPLLLSQTLDWPIKYRIWQTHVKKTNTLLDGRDPIAELHDAARGTGYSKTKLLELLLGPSSPVLDKVAELNAVLRAHSSKWTDLKCSTEATARLTEILDVRFGILGDGLFDSLDRQGLLQHRVVDDEAIEHAMKEAPPGTRARPRSLAVKELAGRSGATCSWQCVIDKRRGVLDLSNPREESATWQAQRTHDQIARRAYLIWRTRGSPHGSPELDWEQAVRQIEGEAATRAEG